MAVYPSLGLHVAEFLHAPRMTRLHTTKYLFNASDKYYYDLNNQKRFFAAFAARKGFDPLHAHNWYSISANDIKSEKVSGEIYSLMIKF
jgi:hypothetical protein